MLAGDGVLVLIQIMRTRGSGPRIGAKCIAEDSLTHEYSQFHETFEVVIKR